MSGWPVTTLRVNIKSKSFDSVPDIYSSVDLTAHIMVKFSGVTNEAILQQYLANHRAEEKAVADAATAAAAEAARALENAKIVEEEEVEKEAAVASGKAKNVKCIKKDCKRRGPSDCPHK